MAKPSLDDLISQVRKGPGPSPAQVAAEKKKKAAKEALKNVPVSKKKPTPGKASQEFVNKAKAGMKAGQKADAVAAKKESLAAKMERRKNLQRKKNELEKKKKEGEERKAKVNAALARATSGPRASSGSNMGGEGASADKAALQSAGRAVQGTAQAVSAATGLDKKMDKLRKKISNRLRPGSKKGLATGAASTGRNNMRPKSSKPSDPWKSNKPKDPWKEEFSHWREEFIFEVDDKVPTKKEKTVQPMSGKNTIIINPDSMQESKKDDTYLETDMKKRKKNNEKAIADMKKVKDDTVPRWMREDSEFSDWRSEIDEGVGMTVAKAIDKTKPPLGRASIRRSVSSALKMREVDKETRRNRTRKFSGVAASEKASKSEKYLSRSSRTTAKEEFENVDEIYMVTPPKKGDKKDAKKKETWYDRDDRKRKERKEEVEHIEEKSIQMQRRVDRYLGRDKAKAKERKDNVGRIRKGREEIASSIARLSNSPGGVPASVARQAEKVGVRRDHFKGAAKAALKNSFEPEGEQLEEDSRRTSNKQQTKRVRSNIKSFGSNYTPPNNWDPDANRGQGEVVTRKQMEKKRRKSLRQEEVEHLGEMPYQVVGSPDGKKEKKIGKPVKSRKYADARAAELADTHKATGGKYRSVYTEATYPSDFKKGSGVAKKKDGRPQQHDQDTDRYGRRKTVDEGKNGLWDNIHARRKAGKPKRKPGDKNYPETLNIKEEEDNTKIIGAPLKSEEDRIPARQGGNQWGIGKSLLCPVCGVVGCTNPEHQVEEGVMPAAIDPAKHRAAQKATKIRNLMKGAATAGEKEAARRKTRGPALAGEHYDWREELGEGAAWTRKEGKNKSGGLNEKGRKSYERENPGSDLKAPSKEPGNKRRSSFCARMKGMKKKLTSKKTASDPDSRINKSLRAWNC